MSIDVTHSIIKQIDSFPALPITVTRVMDVTGDPESSADDLMQAILPDQSMCTTLLKVANSAFFGLPREVSTIDKAVMVLGFNEIRNIVLGKAVFNSFKDIYNTNKKTIDLFWEHSFVCGLAAKIIAEDRGLSASESFVAGLIHDIGKLAMLMSLNSDYAHLLELSDPIQFRTYLSELDLFSVSHDDIGARLLKRWLFPVSLIDAVGYHHRPNECPGTPVMPIIIQIADILSLIHCNPQGIDSGDIMTIIDDFLPEIRELWEINNLDWSDDDLVRWQEELTTSSQRDNAMMNIISS